MGTYINPLNPKPYPLGYAARNPSALDEPLSEPLP